MSFPASFDAASDSVPSPPPATKAARSDRSAAAEIAGSIAEGSRQRTSTSPAFPSNASRISAAVRSRYTTTGPAAVATASVWQQSHTRGSTSVSALARWADGAVYRWAPWLRRYSYHVILDVER